MAALFSLGVFLEPIQQSMSWSRTDVSGVAMLTWVALGVGSFLWGTLSDRTAPRVVVGAGGFLLGLGLVLASQVAMLWQFYATLGALVGLAVGAFYAPLTSTVSKWFGANRGLAVGLRRGLRRRHAALRVADARVLRRAGDGRGVRRDLRAPGDRHGARLVRGGWFYDRLGGYGWFFAAASAIAATAVLFGLGLRSPRPVEREALLIT